MKEREDMDKWTERVYLAWQYFGVVLISWMFFAIQYENKYHFKLVLIIISTILLIKLPLGFYLSKVTTKDI